MRIIPEGTIYNSLLVLGESYMHGKNRKYLCVCMVCGSKEYFFGNNLKKNNSTKCKSCAVKQQITRFANGEQTIPRTPAKKTCHKEYGAYRAMLRRCYNVNDIQYHCYGGRGIKVCDEWKKDFINFITYMGPRPEGCTLDRIDVEGDYSPGNCRWATSKEQGANRRDTIYLTSQGETLPLVTWAQKLGVTRSLLYKRYRGGKNMDIEIQNLLKEVKE